MRLQDTHHKKLANNTKQWFGNSQGHSVDQMEKDSFKMLRIWSIITIVII